VHLAIVNVRKKELGKYFAALGILKLAGNSLYYQRTQAVNSQSLTLVEMMNFSIHLTHHLSWAGEQILTFGL
jgi:hypothetical protein